MNKEICGLREFALISALCHGSAAPQDVRDYRSMYMDHNVITFYYKSDVDAACSGPGKYALVTQYSVFHAVSHILKT